MKIIIVLRTLTVFAFFVSNLEASAPAGRYTDQSGAALTAGSTQVKDTVTGLIWQRTVSGTYTWSSSAVAGSAQLYCNQLVIGSQGAGSWRLPNVKELSSLVDVTVSSGSTIDLVAFPGTPANYFWSSTVYQPSPSLAWVVGFNGGYVISNSVSSTYYARCVR